jgi:hypothetical protein
MTELYFGTFFEHYNEDKKGYTNAAASTAETSISAAASILNEQVIVRTLQPLHFMDLHTNLPFSLTLNGRLAY